MVLTPEEVKAILGAMDGTPWLMAELIYGAELGIHECVTLRVKDLDLRSRTLSIRDSKGSKDRTTLLPHQLVSPLQQHMLRVATVHQEDLAKGAGLAPLPNALARKYPSASASLSWQFVFPSAVLRRWGDSGRLVRWHTSDSTIQRAFKQALMKAGVHKQPHSTASHPISHDGLL